MPILGVIASSGSGGSPTPYHADAVHFDGRITLYTASLTSVDSPLLTVAFPFKISSATPDSALPFFVNDPDNSLSILVAAGVASGAVSTFAIYAEDVSANKQFTISVDAMQLPTVDEWHTCVISIDTNYDAGLKRGAIYIDRVNVTGNVSDNDDAFSMVSDGRPAFIGQDQGDNLIADLSNYFFGPGIVIVDASNLISSASLDLFFDADNKPVDPAVAVAELGNPTILLSGDASAYGTNQGTGGALIKGNYARTANIANPGPTTISLPGAIAGEVVSFVSRFGNDITAQFEATISTNDQIVQTGSEDYTDNRVMVFLTPKSLTNASSSPSD